MRQPPRILMFGPFGHGNFGNDAAFEAGLNWLRATFDDAIISAVCAGPALARERFGVTAFPIQEFPKSIPRWLDNLLLRQPSLWFNWWICLRALRNVDLFLIAGAGVIHDYRDRPWGWPSRFLRWVLAARLAGAPVVLLCVGAGPVINPISRMMMKWLAQLAARRSYRDEGSRAYMKSLGVADGESLVAADLAFLLPTPRPLARADADIVVGLGVMNYRGWRRNDNPALYPLYLENMARFVEYLKSKGHAIRVVIGQTPGDLIAVQDLEKRLGCTLMSSEEKKMSSLQDVMAVLATADIVVASRYHVQIASVKLRRPVLSITYGPMNDALMDAVGLSEFAHHIERIDLPRLVSQYDTLVERRAHYSSIVDAKMAAMEGALDEQLRQFISPFMARRAAIRSPAPPAH